MGLIRDIFGIKDQIAIERRLEREAFLEAMRLQTQMITSWLDMFKTNSAPATGWVNNDRNMWLQEMKTEHGSVDQQMLPEEDLYALQEQIAESSDF